ncbi:galactokinase family protein [Kamptonema cortianum]|nr:galactokinase family protein [Kamptonema cortianum]
MKNASAHAPGRAELLGNHTDYNEGLVLSIAVDKGVTVTGSSRPDNKIFLRAEQFAQVWRTIDSQIAPQTGAVAWVNYPLGVVDELRKRGIRTGGFDLTIRSNLPTGAGLSSSAALEVATALFLQKIVGFRMDRLEMARLCQAAENHFVGVKCGLLDQISSLFGKKKSCRFHRLPLSGGVQYSARDTDRLCHRALECQTFPRRRGIQ